MRHRVENDICKSVAVTMTHLDDQAEQFDYKRKSYCFIRWKRETVRIESLSAGRKI